MKKGQMVIISNSLELKQILSKQKTMPASAMKPNYEGVEFECGCGEMHPVNSTDYLLCGGFNEYFFLCPKGYVSLVKIKGFMRARANTTWSTTEEVFRGAVS